MSFVSLDPQALGWYDDGTEGGALRVAPAGGDLVAMPWPQVGYVRTVSGTGSGAVQHNYPGNPDGSGLAFRMACPATGDGVRAFIPFRGRTFGIRYQIPNTSIVISVGVDGENIPVQLSEPAMTAESTSWVSPGTEGSRITHRDLTDDVLHMAEITMVYTGTALDEVYLHGLLLDRSAGYDPPPRRLVAREAFSVPTTRGSINIVSNAHVLGGIRQIIYWNNSGSTRTVTLSNVASTEFAQFSLADKETKVIDFGGVVGAARQWYHVASGSGVVGTTIGSEL